MNGQKSMNQLKSMNCKIQQ